MTNSLIENQIYDIIDSVHSELRSNHELGKGETAKIVYFKLASGPNVIRIDESRWLEDLSASHCKVCWDNTKKDLQDLARRANNF